MAVKRKPVVMYSTDLAFASAAAAYRINNNQYTTVITTIAEPTRLPNKVVLRSVIQNTTEITDADRELGAKVREYLKTYLFKIVAGVQLNEFDSKALSLATVEEISERDLGYVAYYPVIYEHAQQQQTVDERIFNCSAEYLGKVGDKVEVAAEIVKSFYSRNWNTTYHTAITADNCAVRFTYKEQLQVGSRVTLTGKVKEHGNGYMTKLNYVKLITK
jgi:hypothetical protein